jgi:hypothetical protein
MIEPTHLSTWCREELLALVAERLRQVTEWRASNEALRAEIDQLTRGGKRQAAPFSKGTRVADPKSPGRKPGSGMFRSREAPPPEAITEPPVDVQVPHDTCPDCGGPLAEERVDLASITEIPARPQPQVTRSRGWVCRCTGCGAQVRGRHPDVAPDQDGATVPETPVVYTDDTGWRVGGEPAHLMAFETEGATVYQIRPRHRHEAVQEVLPADDVGVMVTDRGRRDEAQAVDRVAQQQCLAHLLRSLSDVMERKRGRARAFGTPLKTVRQDALALWHRHRDSPVADFKVEAAVLQTELTYQRRDRRLNDRDNQRLLNERGWHHDRGHVLRFLVDPRIEPTNHRAERALRPAVIARKVSHGSTNDAGAHAGQTPRRFAGGESVPPVPRPGRSRNFSLIFHQTSTR